MESVQVFNLLDRIFYLNLEEEFYISIRAEKNSNKDILDSEYIKNIIKKQKQKYQKINSKRKRFNSLYLITNDDCNLNCRFCSMRSNLLERKVNSINLLDMDTIIGSIEKINPRKIIITGGEPTKNSDLLDILKLIKFNNNISSKIYLQTNGTLITEEYFSKLVKLIDGIEMSVGHYKDISKLEDKIEMITKKGIDFVTTLTIDRTINENLDILNLIFKKNIKFILNFINNSGSAYDNNLKIMRYREKIKTYIIMLEYILNNNFNCDNVVGSLFNYPRIRKSCNAFGKMVTIFPNGDIGMCNKSFDDFFKINKYNDIIDEINNKIESKEYQELLCVDKKTMCKDCKFRYFCGGTCVADELINSIDIEGCKMNKTFIVFNLLIYDCKMTNHDNIKSLKKYLEFCYNNPEWINNV
ncbi:TPA: radical SAM protein [Streptococcus agalactiae]|nr:radical SAM protein [Peptoniphilus harei]